jgi:ribosomal protein L22
MADEQPKNDSPAGAEESSAQKPARRRGRAVAAEPVEAAAAAAEKPKRIRRASRKAGVEPAAEAAPAAEPSKPRRSPVRAKAVAQETPAAESAAEPAPSDTPKPRRIRARAAKAEDAAATPAPKRPARPAAKKPAAPTRRLVPGSARASKDAAVLGPQLVHAHARYVRSSARKARIVCNHIRGKSVPEARAILAFAPRGVAKDWAKLLNSAVANAEHNHELIGDELRIKQVTADVGPTLKRFRPRAMGRATPINKRTSHLSITLAPKE